MAFKYPLKDPVSFLSLQRLSCAFVFAFVLEDAELKEDSWIDLCIVDAVQTSWCQTFKDFKSWYYLFLAVCSWKYAHLCE